MLTFECLEDRLCCDVAPPPAELLPPPNVVPVPALPAPRLDLGVPNATPQVGPVGPYPAGPLYPGTDAIPGTGGVPVGWPVVAPAPLAPITFPK